MIIKQFNTTLNLKKLFPNFMEKIAAKLLKQN